MSPNLEPDLLQELHIFSAHAGLAELMQPVGRGWVVQDDLEDLTAEEVGECIWSTIAKALLFWAREGRGWGFVETVLIALRASTVLGRRVADYQRHVRHSYYAAIMVGVAIGEICYVWGRAEGGMGSTMAAGERVVLLLQHTLFRHFPILISSCRALDSITPERPGQFRRGWQQFAGRC